MDEHYTVVIRKGQITLPAAVRKALGLAIGDRVAVHLEEDGQLRAAVRPVCSVADATFGALRSHRKALGEEEITEAAWEVDAYHATLIEHYGQHNLYSFDRDFDRIPSLQRREQVQHVVPCELLKRQRRAT